MRDNSQRASTTVDPTAAVTEMVNEEKPTLHFSTPTEFVDLPSKGKFYPEDHPLHKQEMIEIKYMTAKDEDILTSPTLLKKGLAIERFLQNIIVDRRIKVDSLLSGDKNALLVAARINGFGPEYKTKFRCPACMVMSDVTFDLAEVDVDFGGAREDLDVVENESGTFTFKLPQSGHLTETRLLTAKDENELTTQAKANKSKFGRETGLIDQLKKIIVSVNGSQENKVINQFILHMPARDSRHLRNAYLKVIPSLDMTQHYSCEICGYSQEVDIPLTVDFFWSRQ
jgi:hypothetical protein